jgi:CheY-like chemotaxis protein
VRADGAAGRARRPTGRLLHAFRACRRAGRADGEAAEVLASLGHDLRTPINGVLGWATLLLDTRLTAEQREYADGVRRAGEGLLAIVNAVVEFARVEAGQVHIVRATFAPAGVVEEAAERVAEAAQAKDVELVHHVDRGVPAAASGDARRIGQVLGILLDNAVRLTSTGEVVVRARVVAADKRRQTLRFEVADTGPGITPARQAELFAPLPAGRREGGAGVGLAVARALVALMGGEIGVRSEPTSGSIFWFTVPVGREATVAPPTRWPGMPRILVVDDRLTSRAVVEEQLRAWGVRSNGAADAATARARLTAGVAQGDPYVLAIVDVDLPGTDGVALARALAADPRLADLPLVLLAPVAACARIDAQRPAAAVATLSKPIRPAHLRAALEAALSDESSARRSPRAAGS